LDDEGGNALRLGEGETESELRAVVVKPDDVTFEAQRVDEGLQEVGVRVEGVSEFVRGRCCAVAESRHVRGNETPPMTEGGHQVAVNER
jgi:hypothetical protein